MSLLNVLCVDDDHDILEVLRLALSLDPNMDVRTTNCGHEALRTLASREWMVDCILLDIRMPTEDGRILLGEIRTIPWHTYTPVVFVTASVRPVDKREVTILGAKGLIAKPFDPLNLAGIVRTMIGMPEHATAPSDQD